MSSTFLTPALRIAASEVATLLKERNETISVAETAAGGLISAALLAMPGASKYYKGGLTLYTLPSRLAYAGWTDEDTATYSGPTTTIVTNLAAHTLKTLNSTYSLSESGTAGPTGGSTRTRTPGFVALAVVRNDGKAFTKEVETGSSEREGNMVAFAVEGLKLLKSVLDGEAGSGEGVGGWEERGPKGEGKL